jgi:hypothetical protein
VGTAGNSATFGQLRILDGCSELSTVCVSKECNSELVCPVVNPNGQGFLTLEWNSKRC